jgi:site-specific DNA-methyltransferase (adenine-specific)
LLKTELFLKGATLEVVARYRRDGLFTAVDACRFLESLRPGIADIIFLDPPFNLGKDYGISSRIESAPPEEYECYLQRIVAESARVLRDGGALFMYHIPYWAARLSGHLQAALTFRHWIAVSMKNGFVRGRNLYPAHYALLYYSKGSARAFKRPRDPASRCRHCGELIKDYGGYRKIVEARGLNLSDVWEDLSPVRHRTTKTRVANELPRRLTDRVVDIAGFKNALLIDPFVGSGTSLVSAISRNMRFVANDLSRRNVSRSLRRLES